MKGGAVRPQAAGGLQLVQNLLEQARAQIGAA